MPGLVFLPPSVNNNTEQATFGSPSVPAGSSALLRPSPAGGLQSPAEPLRVSGFARPRWKRSTAPPAATVPVAPRPPPRRCRCFKVATPFRRVGCAHSLSVVMPPPCRHPRGGLSVAPSSACPQGPRPWRCRLHPFALAENPARLRCGFADTRAFIRLPSLRCPSPRRVPAREME